MHDIQRLSTRRTQAGPYYLLVRLNFWFSRKHQGIALNVPHIHASLQHPPYESLQQKVSGSQHPLGFVQVLLFAGHVLPRPKSIAPTSFVSTLRTRGIGSAEATSALYGNNSKDATPRKRTILIVRRKNGGPFYTCGGNKVLGSGVE